MAHTNTYCANGHAVPAGEKVCPVCGAPAVSKGAARRDAAIAGVVALGLLGGGIFGVTRLVHRNDPPEQPAVVVQEVQEPAAPPAAEPAAPEEPAQAAEPAAPAQPAQPATANFVRDETGLLSAHSAELNTALERVAADTPYRMFVVFANTFGGMDSVQWAQQAAREAGLGDNDVLLAVSPNDQQYGLSYGPRVALTNAQWDTVQNSVEASLGQALRGQVDWTAAPISMADALISVTR